MSVVDILKKYVDRCQALQLHLEERSTLKSKCAVRGHLKELSYSRARRRTFMLSSFVES